MAEELKEYVPLSSLATWRSLLCMRILFHKCDVAQWDDVLALFEAGHRNFGTIHTVLSNAGIAWEVDVLNDVIDESTGKLAPPDTKVLQVNLVGMLYVVKVAVHYFSKWPKTRCSVVMTGSAASFLDTPPAYTYCASKTGVLGMLRGMRTQLIRRNITINAVLPWLTSNIHLPSRGEKGFANKDRQKLP